MTPQQDFSQGRMESAETRSEASPSAGGRGGACLASPKAVVRRVILCVEDEPECSSLIKEELEERGFDVIVADNGRDGLSILRESYVDLILCDVNLPEMSGFELLEELRESSPELASVPFVFLTGLNDKASEMNGRRLGADDYVAKPIDFEILHSIVNARLAGIARTRVASGVAVLTPREAEILGWVAQGKTRDEIARIVGVTKRTVDFHLDNARKALGVESLMEATVKAAVLGLVECEGATLEAGLQFSKSLRQSF